MMRKLVPALLLFLCAGMVYGFVNPETNETVTYFFNIDKPFNWLGQSLKK